MNLTPAQDLRHLHGIERDRALLIAAVREAGGLAMRYFRSTNEVAQKADGSVVSEADIAVDLFLRRTLGAARPDYGWLSEETPVDEARFTVERLWIVDPIDGTRGFVEGKGEWTISAALVENGEAIAGAVYNPVSGELFDAARGGGARLGGAPIHATQRKKLEGAKLLGSASLFRPNRWKEAWPHIHVRWVSSIAYRMSLVAAGKADATMSLGTYADWDIAAASLIVEEAGGRATNRFGEPFRFNASNLCQAGMVAGAPAIQRDMIDRLRRQAQPAQPGS